MYPTAAESTATETVLGAKRRSAMESAAVVAARMVRTAIAVVATRTVRAAGVAMPSAASENDDDGHRQKSVERPSPAAERRR